MGTFSREASLTSKFFVSLVSWVCCEIKEFILWGANSLLLKCPFLKRSDGEKEANRKSQKLSPILKSILSLIKNQEILCPSGSECKLFSTKTSIAMIMNQAPVKQFVRKIISLQEGPPSQMHIWPGSLSVKYSQKGYEIKGEAN